MQYLNQSTSPYLNRNVFFRLKQAIEDMRERGYGDDDIESLKQQVLSARTPETGCLILEELLPE